MDVETLKEAKVNIGIIGCGKQGKSTLINSLFEYEPNDKRAAKASAYEGGGTTELQKFKHPKNDSVLLWDLPGLTDSNRDTYDKTIKMKENDYDMFIVVTKDSVANYSVADLLKLTIRKGAPNRPIIYVKTHTDAALKGYKHDEDIKRVLNDAEFENFLNTQREEIKEFLKKQRKEIPNTEICDKVFIVDSTDKKEFDFPGFVEYTRSNCGVWLIKKKQTILWRRIRRINRKATIEKSVPFAKYFSDPAKATALGEMFLYLTAFDLINKESDQNCLTNEEVKELIGLMEKDIASTRFGKDDFFELWKQVNKSSNRGPSKKESSVMDTVIQRACGILKEIVESEKEVNIALESTMKVFSEELAKEPLELDILANMLCTLGSLLWRETEAGIETAIAGATSVTKTTIAGGTLVAKIPIGATILVARAANTLGFTVKLTRTASGLLAVELGHNTLGALGEVEIESAFMLVSKALSESKDSALTKWASALKTLSATTESTTTASAAIGDAAKAASDALGEAASTLRKNEKTLYVVFFVVAAGALFAAYNPFKVDSEPSSLGTQLENALKCATQLAEAREKQLAHKEAHGTFKYS